MKRAPRKPVPASARRERIPPALARGTERFEGLPVLEELRDDLGVLLWRSARNVLLWAECAPQERARLFAGEAAGLRLAEVRRLAPDAELHGPLAVIASLLESPASVDVRRLVNACRRIATWAEERSAVGTALTFATAAALAEPSSAALAYAVGRLARRRAEFDRAESWYIRAVVQGRQHGDWRSYALSLSGVANLWMQKGNFPAAKRYHQRCLRAARRRDMPEIEAFALHDLFVVAAECGDRTEAESYALEASRAYGAFHANVRRLAYDVAHYWTIQGSFAHALSVYRALVPAFPDPAERVLVLGELTRAAGGTGDVQAALAAADEVFGIVEQGHATGGFAAGALLGCAQGLASVRRWEAAERAAEQAVAIATERREGKVLVQAESVLDYVRAGRPAQPAHAPSCESTEPLAEDLVASLRSWAGAAVAAA